MSRLVQQIALLAIVGFGSLNGLAATLSSVPGFTPVLGQGSYRLGTKCKFN